jgi:tRNA pseudouridine38-40 synthase
LKNMVRIIVGTLVEAGRGRLRPGDVEAALATGERARAGPTAPPHGLALVRVDYELPLPVRA